MAPPITRAINCEDWVIAPIDIGKVANFFHEVPELLELYKTEPDEAIKLPLIQSIEST
jgi:hypothetical protein